MWVLDAIMMVVFMYLVWRKLRENHSQRRAVGLGWLLVGGFFVGSKLMGLLLAGLSPDFGGKSWWSVSMEPVGGWLLAVVVVCWWGWILEDKVWQVAEDVIMPVVALMLWFQLRKTVSGFDWRQLALASEMIIAMVIAGWLSGKYRSLWWYKSGKKGFVFFFLSFVVLGLLGVAELIMGGRIWLGVGEVLLGLLFWAGLFILGRG